jgi:formamidopyrimidine-DNA glycosylase
LHLIDDMSKSTAELAFMDARRLGRVRLCTSPLTEPPISELGFDPILSMPTLDGFTPLVLKRSCPIKALLLDQSFSAGVGNWVAGRVPSYVQSLLMFRNLQMKYFIMPEYILDNVAIHYQVNS